VGQRLLEREHKLAVGSQSVIGRVTQIGEPVIARDTDSDSLHAVNELLPNTRSELALPIFDGDQIIGALDVQSTRRDAYSTTDVQALQVMANQLGVSIRNARLFEEQVRSVNQNRRLRAEAETTLREIERLNSQLTRTMWDNYLNEQTQTAAITLSADTLQSEADWSPAMREAQQQGRPVTRYEGDELVVAVPIVLRGEPLGAIEIATGVRSEHDAHEIGQAVADRMATTLDNIRLYDEAQASAMQEQRISAVVSRYQTAGSIEDLLQITLAELNRTLEADYGMIRLGLNSAEAENGADNRSTHMNGRSPHD
jgi:GAF domain-containing protein